MQTTKTIEAKATVERSPVVAIMGHIDHGKSTLLSYIRKSKEPLNEAGGITQHISAYEVEHETKEGKKQTITFIDTPGHEAFGGIRKRGASVADVAVLVVSAEDGVKPQTIEALNSIKDSHTPYVVAINKIDKPEANIDRTKQSLAENEIYVEGWGGDIPVVALSAKTGEGVPELLDMIILVAELENLTGDRNTLAEGIVIESNRDTKKGITATCIIKNGSMEKGMFIVSGVAIAPVRIMENYLGKQIDKASFSSPIRIIGWDELPIVGNRFQVFDDRNKAREAVEAEKEKIANKKSAENSPENFSNEIIIIPVLVKADTGSSLEAAINQIKKLGTETVKPQVVASGIGTISENDIRLASGTEKAVIIGFNVKVDSPAKNLAERSEIEIKTFDIIYKMTEWLEELIKTKTPKIKVEEITGRAKVLKVFSKLKDKQILGGRVETGKITLGSQVKIKRRDSEIGEGKVRELQQQKNATEEVREGSEFGAMIVSNIEIAPGDHIECIIVTEQ
ncbi:MAG: translation initiation factor IF-2 [Parcubacteria bacterium C7867-006]|nr:MAG: translation initiation factor IF-2 [Parcubacteria bacterium C7867-006]